MVRAWCHTADNALGFEFDAEPWLREADVQSLLHLVRNGWSSERIVEGLEHRPGYEGLHQLIDYAQSRLGAETLEDPAWATFECKIDASEAAVWLAVSRPDVLPLIQGKPAEATRTS
jgi:hypothetical protein